MANIMNAIDVRVTADTVELDLDFEYRPGAWTSYSFSISKEDWAALVHRVSDLVLTEADCEEAA